MVVGGGGFCYGVFGGGLGSGDGGHGDFVGEGFPGFVCSAAAVGAAGDVELLAVGVGGVAVLVGACEVVEGVGGDVGSCVAVDGVDPDGVESDEDFDGVLGGAVGVGDFGWVEVGLDGGGDWWGVHGFMVVGGGVWGRGVR